MNNIISIKVSDSVSTPEELLEVLKYSADKNTSESLKITLEGPAFFNYTKVDGDFVNKVLEVLKNKQIDLLTFDYFEFNEYIAPITLEGRIKKLTFNYCRLSIEDHTSSLTEESYEIVDNLFIDEVVFINVSNLFSFENIKFLSPASKAIKKLGIRNTPLNSFKGLDCFPSVKQLFVDNNQLVSFKDFPLLNDLEELRISENHIRDFKYFPKLPKLTFLGAYSNKIFTLKDLPSLPSLESLYLVKNNLTSLAGLKKQSSLTSLNVSENKIIKVGASNSLRSLRSLMLNNNLLTDLNLEYCSNLKILEVKSNNLTQLDLKNIVDLNILICSYNSIKRIFNSNEKFRTKVRSLYADKNRIHDLKDIMVEITEDLVLHNNPISSLECLEGTPSIKSLELNNCIYLSSLVGSSEKINLNLTYLNINNNVRMRTGITNEDVFKHFPNLEVIYLRNSRLLNNLNGIGILKNLSQVRLENPSFISIPMELVCCSSLSELKVIYENYVLSSKELNNILVILALNKIINLSSTNSSLSFFANTSLLKSQDVVNLLNTNAFELITKNKAHEIATIPDSYLNTLKEAKVKDVLKISVKNSGVEFKYYTSFLNNLF